MSLRLILSLVTFVILIVAIVFLLMAQGNLKKANKYAELSKIIQSMPGLGGYGGCYRCNRAWNEVEGITHMTSDNSGLFLFCEECDEIVTVEERWQALDRWKSFCLAQIKFYDDTEEMKDKERKKTKETEFIEWPRDVAK